MYLSELCWINLIFWLFFEFHLVERSTLPPLPSSFYPTTAILISLCYLLSVWLCPLSFFYRSSRAGSVVRNVLTAQTYAFLAFLLALNLTHRLEYLRPWGLLALWVACCVVLTLWRFAAKLMIRYLRSKGRNMHYVVMIGNTENIPELYREMCDPYQGYLVKGYFYDQPVAGFPEGLTYRGTPAQVIPFLEHEDISQIYCSLPSERDREILPILSYCEQHCIRFLSIPDIRNYLKRQMNLEFFGNVPVLYMREDPLAQVDNRFFKRAFDVIVSLLFMIPFWLIIYPLVALITKLTSPGPVFFKQQRNGLGGKVFYCYKFRSMRVNADSDRLQATANDPRKTKFGEFLRHTSIDELPQFINVLKGEMSIVGPRPHMVKHTQEYSALIDKYMVRHWVKPGITGWAQVNGARGETKRLSQMEDRIVKDVWYIEHWSFWLDLKIIFLTVYNALRGDKQAY
jgi:putative colanic acid biosynthesis UDP-glucose lipid carrier transferase